MGKTHPMERGESVVEYSPLHRRGAGGEVLYTVNL
jgi:hypothetical protein